MVLVQVNEGMLEGETVTNEIGGTFYSFKGIPYASPPLGDLRFKAPEPPKSWDGVRSANNFSHQCPQFNFITKTYEKGSEDCLYLNIYTPRINKNKLLPVMIWIHGGGFRCGNGNDDTYGPEFLIRHGVILVTLNYRLEVIGFLCLDTDDVPGNAGIKDQVAAIKWVKNNIISFGGDPGNITLFGQSAGAVCVTYHCVSPMTKGLFQRAIAQSGTMANWWALCFRPRERSLALAKRLGCMSENDKEIYEFFKKVPSEYLLNTQIPLTFSEKFNDKCEVNFLIVSEKSFPNVEPYFTGDTMDALRNGIHDDVELIIGYNEDEGIINLAISFDIQNTIYQANNFKQYFVPKLMTLYCSTDDQLEIGNIIKQYYFKEKRVTLDNMNPLVRFYGTEMFKFDILETAKLFSKKNNVFLYKFTCKSERNFIAKISGMSEYFRDKTLASHIDEIYYLFPVKSVNQKINKSSETFRMINNITKLWTNFAKTGNPTPDPGLGVYWKPFNLETKSYLEIGNKLLKGYSPDKEEFDLWETIYSKYLPSRLSNYSKEAINHRLSK